MRSRQRTYNAARRVRGVEDIRITAKTDHVVLPLPEGASYLGFIFARGGESSGVVDALREAHALCDEENDVATASLIENWIDQAERRVWFLYETARRGSPGH